MKTFPLLKRRGSHPFETTPAPGEVEGSDTSADDDTPDLQWVGTGSTALITRAMVVGLWALVLLAPTAVAVVVTSGTSEPAESSPAAAVGVDVDEQTAVSGFAEGFVATWLSTPEGGEDQLSPYIASASAVTLPPRPWRVADVATAGLQSNRDHLWAVTIAATVTDPAGPAVPSRRYFQVPVAYDAGAMVAQMLPAPVAAPPPATAPETAYRYRVSPGEPLTQAAQEFLDALLAGSGDVARYTSPGSVIAAVNPAPYTEVSVDDVQVDVDIDESATTPQTGDELHLLVTATATTASGKDGQVLSPITVQYPLTMTARDGRWEVSAIDQTPATAVPEPTTGASDTTDPTDSTATPTPTQ